MKQTKVFLILLLSLILNLINMPVGHTAEPGLFAKYTGPAGVTIYSYSQKWSQVEQLKDVYNCLLENVHGSELAYLEAVKLMPGNSPYGASTAGMYFSTYSLDDQDKTSYSKGAYIELYNMDQKVKVQEVAKTLAHEYGHHFTIFHLWMGEGVSFNNWSESKWAKARGLQGDKRVGIVREHQWLPEEIAAEDYVQLFGGPQAKATLQFESRIGTFTSQVFNLSPQENLNLPLAAELPGYRQYWENLAKVKVPGNEAPTQPELALVQLGKGDFGSKRLTFEWHPALDDKAGPLTYTLVYYQPGDTLPVPVKTMVDGYQASFDYAPYHENGTMLFRVFVQDAQGLLVSSKPISVNLADPQVRELGPAPLFRDVTAAQWYYDSIATLYKQGLVSGYQNNTFLPNGQITRAELTTIVAKLRQLKGTTAKSIAFTDLDRHWAAGAIYAAAEAGLVGGYEDGSFEPNRPVTRAELAVLVARLVDESAGDSKVTFTDVPGHWAAGSISQVAALGLMGGYQDGSFQPERQATRAETATVLAGLLDM